MRVDGGKEDQDFMRYKKELARQLGKLVTQRDFLRLLLRLYKDSEVERELEMEMEGVEMEGMGDLSQELDNVKVDPRIGEEWETLMQLEKLDNPIPIEEKKDNKRDLKVIDNNEINNG